MKMVDLKDGRITKQLLKTRSGEFDIESILALCLRDLGISDLGCICECANLVKLDLFSNQITKLHKLAGLNNLVNLNLSSNNIEFLDGLQALENLQTLNLSGNSIKSVGEFRCLTGLENLSELRVHDKVKCLSNPVCMGKEHYNELKVMLPRLLILDGERVNGRGKELFEIFHEMDRLLGVDLSHGGETTRSGPWLPENLLKIDTSKFDNSSLGDSEKQLKDLLASCHQTAENSEDLLRKLKAD